MGRWVPIVAHLLQLIALCSAEAEEYDADDDRPWSRVQEFNLVFINYDTEEYMGLSTGAIFTILYSVATVYGLIQWKIIARQVAAKEKKHNAMLAKKGPSKVASQEHPPLAGLTKKVPPATVFYQESELSEHSARAPSESIKEKASPPSSPRLPRAPKGNNDELLLQMEELINADTDDISQHQKEKTKGDADNGDKKIKTPGAASTKPATSGARRAAAAKPASTAKRDAKAHAAKGPSGAVRPKTPSAKRVSSDISLEHTQDADQKSTSRRQTGSRKELKSDKTVESEYQVKAPKK